jgi:peptide/nickel transport system ATP-binding protein
VQEVSFTIQAGQTVGVVGESGCGKSVTAMALMGLLPPQAARIDGGEILRGPRSAAAESQTDGRPARPPAGDDLSGTDVGPEPGVDHRRAAVRTAIRHLGATPKAAWQQATQLLSEVGWRAATA